MLKLFQTLHAYFQKNEKLPAKSARTSKQLLSSSIEPANNHVEGVAKETTAEGAKGRKEARDWDLNRIIFL